MTTRICSSFWTCSGKVNYSSPYDTTTNERLGSRLLGKNHPTNTSMQYKNTKAIPSNDPSAKARDFAHKVHTLYVLFKFLFLVDYPVPFPQNLVHSDLKNFEKILPRHPYGLVGINLTSCKRIYPFIISTSHLIVAFYGLLRIKIYVDKTICSPQPMINPCYSN